MTLRTRLITGVLLGLTVVTTGISLEGKAEAKDFGHLHHEKLEAIKFEKLKKHKKHELKKEHHIRSKKYEPFRRSRRRRRFKRSFGRSKFFGHRKFRRHH